VPRLRQGKFSPIAYAHHNQTLHSPDLVRQPNPEDAPKRDEQFRRWVEDIRSELVAYRGRTEEERLQFNESLNRAIIGFDEDRRKLLAMIEDLLESKRIHDLTPPGIEYETMADAMFAELIGLNVLELILRNKEGLEEIQVVGKQIFEVRNGRESTSAYKLQTVEELERIQQNLVLFNDESLNRRKKWAEVALKDGSRVTMTGFGYTSEPTLTIRLYTVKHFTLAALCERPYQTISEPIRILLGCILRARFNIVVIGPTNSGKTHLIKALIAELPQEERLITLESRFELMLRRDFPDRNIVEYEVDPEDRLHDGNQAFKLALRQSPKRICNAEIRDEDANIYVRACTRGHEGSMTSVHVNELEDVPEAIVDMCMQDGRKINPDRLTKRIATYVTQIGIEMGVVDGQRKIVRIGEFAYEQGEVRMHDLVRFDFVARIWECPLAFSERAMRRISKFDPAAFTQLKERGVLT
jgi:pilus assembly protein CpaF